MLPELFGAPTGEKSRGEDRAEALPIFTGPPSIDGVVWSNRRRNHHEDPPHGPCRQRGSGAPKCCRSCLGRRVAEKLRGDNRAEALPIFYWAPKRTESVATMAARRTVEANVSAARRADAATAAAANNEAAASAARGDDEATAFAARLARVTMAARRTDNVEAAAVASTTTPRRMMAPIRASGGGLRARQRRPDARELTRRRSHRRWMMPRTMTSPPRDEDSHNGANDDADDNVERGAKLRAAGKADEYSARRVRAATTPHDSVDDSYDSADKVTKPRATDKADEATRDCARRGRVAVARKSAMAV